MESTNVTNPTAITTETGLFKSIKLAVVAACRATAKVFIHAETAVDAAGHYAQWAETESSLFVKRAEAERAKEVGSLNRELEGLGLKPLALPAASLQPRH